MSNQVNYRRATNRRNKRRQELPFAFCCAGEGHNGQKGRSQWKALSRRNERRALKEGRLPRIGKRNGNGRRRTFSRPIVTDKIVSDLT